jgi:hypothetical protein
MAAEDPAATAEAGTEAPLQQQQKQQHDEPIPGNAPCGALDGVAENGEDDDDDDDNDEDDDDGCDGPSSSVAGGDGVGGTPPPRAQKRRERLEQNRLSARESRKRKKTMIDELQRTVIALSRENGDLNDRNWQLRARLMEVGEKVSPGVPFFLPFSFPLECNIMHMLKAFPIKLVSSQFCPQNLHFSTHY